MFWTAHAPNSLWVLTPIIIPSDMTHDIRYHVASVVQQTNKKTHKTTEAKTTNV